MIFKKVKDNVSNKLPVRIKDLFSKNESNTAAAKRLHPQTLQAAKVWLKNKR